MSPPRNCDHDCKPQQPGRAAVDQSHTSDRMALIGHCRDGLSRALRAGPLDGGGRWLMSSNAGLVPPVPAGGGRPWTLGVTVGARGSDVEASDVKDADVVCIRAIEK